MSRAYSTKSSAKLQGRPRHWAFRNDKENVGYEQGYVAEKRSIRMTVVPKESDLQMIHHTDDAETQPHSAITTKDDPKT